MLVSWFITYLRILQPTCLHRGYNPFTKYHGHASSVSLGSRTPPNHLQAHPSNEPHLPEHVIETTPPRK